MAVVKQITIKGDTSDAVKSFEDLTDTIQEQKDITIEFEKELVKLERQLKETGKAEFNPQRAKIKKDIIQVKEALKDQRISLKELNNERSKSVKSNKNFATGLRKTGVVVRGLDRVTGGLASSFIDVGKAASLSGKAMKSALISSGIGALVVLVGLLVEHWESIVNFITGSNDEIQTQINKSQELLDGYEFQLDILEIQKKTLENQGKSTTQIKKDIEETLKIQLVQTEILIEQLNTQLKTESSKAIELTLWQKIQIAAEGRLGFSKLINDEEKDNLETLKKSVEEETKNFENIKLQLSQIEVQKKKDNQAAIKRREQEASKEEERLNKILQQQIKLAEQLENLNSQSRLKQLELQEQIAQEDLDNLIGSELEKQDAQIALDNLFSKKRNKILEDEQAERLKLDQSIIDAENERQLAQLKFEESIAEKDSEKLELKREQLELENELILEDLERKRELFALGTQARVDAEQDFLTKKQGLTNQEVLLDKQANDIKIADDKKVQETKLLLANTTLGAIQKLTKQNSTLGKAAAAAAALINTFQGITAELATKTVTPLGFALKLANIASVTSIGFKAVKDILKTNTSSTPSAPSSSGGVGASAPSFNLVGGTSQNQIGDSITGQAEPVQAFVVSSNVTDAQELERNLIDNASI